MPAAPLAAFMEARLKGAANVIGAGSEYLSDKSIVGKPTHLSRGLGWYRRDHAAVDDELAAGGIRREDFASMHSLTQEYSIK